MMEKKSSPRRVPYSSRSAYNSAGRKIKGRGAVVRPSFVDRCTCCELPFTTLPVGPRGSVIERRSLASVLSPSCARPVADE